MFEGVYPEQGSGRRPEDGAASTTLHQCNHHLDYRSQTEPRFAEKHNRKHV